ncbi:hypothetical protein MUB48_07450 [Blautia sp. NSJ-157]|uniref:hypothetical protein n=1 Tax=Blautia sp. NSJ-157 TaxID=2931393 RepID=UPI001FD0009A|nr:hypothetical protein [Blautia sp. NSJ-157]MCJ7861246.1 hypothetical protein [Blautia sp. NSJ-157]
MIHLRLCKGLSYLGTVRATKAEPDVYVSEEKVKDLVDSGYFEMVSSEADKEQTLTDNDEKSESVEDIFGEEPEEDENKGNPELMELQKKNKSELIEYADKKGIDITGCKTKDDIYQKIVEAIARAEAARAALREG